MFIVFHLCLKNGLKVRPIHTLHQWVTARSQ